ncbi:MAG: signal transduction histidine kinase [Desulforhopalus sp.]|jgi:signal transduction histidine kinase
MPSHLSLRARIVGIFSAMASIVLLGGLSMLWYSYQIDNTFRTMVNKELVLYKIAGDMELGLANQKGLLTYYLVDGDGKWLQSLGQYRQIFQQNLDRALSLDLNPAQKEDLNVIVEKYDVYVEAKDYAIENYKSHDINGNISSLHEKQRDVFFSLLEKCRAFSQGQWTIIEEIKDRNTRQSIKLRAGGTGVVVGFVCLSCLFLYFLYKHVLGPIRLLALEAGSSPQDSSQDEVESLSQSFKGMMRDFDQTHDELAKSRKHLIQAERMAMVGELAAGVAHTIRNPFTSIKMRMFSLTRTLNLNDVQNEDLNVISDEIARIDKIVQNFLEFARPPKLKLQLCNLAELIQSVSILVEYRLKEYDAELVYEPGTDLPKVYVDSDRIKEALVNLVTNSCEAMEGGGRVYIAESREHDKKLGDVAVITVRDTGPGVPESIRYKITSPFFTTKEEGSGLGLSIVNRIMKEHNGRLIVEASIDQGVAFILKIPINRDAS